jgi:RNA polymerase sigma-70 factor (ECF subfamily)
MFSQLCDADLVRHIADGERGAEAELYRRFAPRARLYGLRHLRDAERARDLMQMVMLAVLVAARAGRVNDPARIDRFVLGTCRNVAGRMRQNEARSQDAAVLADFTSPDYEHVDLGSLIRCLGKLDERARLVVGLTFHEGQSADEVAASLGTTAGNVRVLRHRAVAALRRCLDGAPGRDEVTR